MNPLSNDAHGRFFTGELPSGRPVSTIRVEDGHIHGHVKDRGHAWQATSMKNTTGNTGSWCSWQKVLTIICAINAAILLVAAIVIPIYVVRFVQSGQTTTTTTAAAAVTLPNQCYNYTTDTDPTRLATYSVYNSGGCDMTLFSNATWVRFGGTATRMASTPPAVYRCSTSATGWYTGALPSTVGVTVTGVVCYSWSSTICDFRNTVSVTNCNGFYVYLLVSPTQCALRYCSE